MIFYRESHRPEPPWERLRIEDAQPRETMVAELMADIATGESPWARLDGSAIDGYRIYPGLLGDVLTIWDDYGHRYIYRVVGYDWQADAFELEWPD